MYDKSDMSVIFLFVEYLYILPHPLDINVGYFGNIDGLISSGKIINSFFWTAIRNGDGTSSKFAVKGTNRLTGKSQ